MNRTKRVPPAVFAAVLLLLAAASRSGEWRATGSVGIETRAFWETGAHDVLVVEGEDGRRRLVPTAAALIREIDAEGRRIVVEDLPGLFEPI